LRFEGACIFGHVEDNGRPMVPNYDNMDATTSRVASSTDEAYQSHILQGVSRTFALTIPALPASLCRVVSNAYLLCRIADTIEDEVALSSDQKHEFAEQFIQVLNDGVRAEDFAVALHPLLSERTLDAERDLIENTPRVIRVTRTFSPVQRKALARCVRIMSRGMAEFQREQTPNGLADMPEMDRYCYHVAGVVGEMLTELFCDYSAELKPHREVMMHLAVSFGQGLQMTNILKDVWEDRERGACWLPRDVFLRSGFHLRDLSPEKPNQGFGVGMEVLIGVAQQHLRNALEYTLMFPKHEVGIRRFCLWALGMAVLTLRKIHANLDFTSGKQVKIARRSVKFTVLATNATAGSDGMLRLLFDVLTRRLPVSAGHERIASGS